MIFFTYFSSISIPIIILIIIYYGVKEKKEIFDLFIDGAKEGAKITFNLLPTLIGIFFSIGLLRASGAIDALVSVISPIAKIVKIPSEIIPLALIRPISGSGAVGIATDIMKNYGVDSYIGNVASIIMGSTETTIYTIAIYTSGLMVKKCNSVLISALVADAVAIVCSVFFCSFLSWSFSWHYGDLRVLLAHEKIKNLKKVLEKHMNFESK